AGSWCAGQRRTVDCWSLLGKSRQGRGDRSGLQYPDSSVSDSPFDVLGLLANGRYPASKACEVNDHCIIEGRKCLLLLRHLVEGDASSALVAVQACGLACHGASDAPVWRDLVGVRGDGSSYDAESQTPRCFYPGAVLSLDWGEHHARHVCVDHA